MKKTVFAILAFPACLLAEGEAVAPEAVSAGTSFIEIFKSGGMLMWPLVLISVFALASVVYLLITLRPGATVPTAVVNDVMDCLQNGKLDEARHVCDYRPCPFSRIAMAAIDSAQNLPDGDISLLTSVTEGEGARQAERLNARTQWLLDIASIAPMIGLLGTVIGMFNAFHGIGNEIEIANKPAVLADGVSMAMITTVAGLVIAIPCMVFYAWFRRRAQRQVAALECASSDIVTVIAAHRKASK